MGLSVAVIGAAGYAGGELLRLLSQHPEVNDYVATSRSQAGMRVGEVHPALAALSDATFSNASPAEAAAGRDVVFLALEHGESSKIAAEVALLMVTVFSVHVPVPETIPLVEVLKVMFTMSLRS